MLTYFRSPRIRTRGPSARKIWNCTWIRSITQCIKFFTKINIFRATTFLEVQNIWNIFGIIAQQYIILYEHNQHYFEQEPAAIMVCKYWPVRKYPSRKNSCFNRKHNKSHSENTTTRVYGKYFRLNCSSNYNDCIVQTFMLHYIL
jgi:hypothetical protein